LKGSSLINDLTPENRDDNFQCSKEEILKKIYMRDMNHSLWGKHQTYLKKEKNIVLSKKKKYCVECDKNSLT